MAARRFVDESEEEINIMKENALSPSTDRRLPLGRQEENFLLSSGVNPGAILPSGTFQNCSFTFNVNVNNSL